MSTPDVRIVWLNVHGGVFHKLLTLHGRLTDAGLSCEVLIAIGPPRGLKLGVDVPVALLPELAARGVHFLPRDEALLRAQTSPARLLLTEAHQDAALPGLIENARAHGAITAQMATLLADFTCHGADHLLLQHPLALFYELEYHRTQESRWFFAAKGIHFTGNIFFEPTLNELHGGFASRRAFFEKYALDPARPLCLWLPNSADVRHPDYGQVLGAAKDAGLNLLAKLHPWEYAFKKHGTDTWRLGTTSDALWHTRAVDEADSTWAYHFCDLAIMRTSATSMEMPFWDKPAAQLPTTAYSGIVRAQALMVASCTVLLPDIEALPGLLRKRPLPVFSPAEYAAARAKVRLDCSRDAYAQTVDAVTAILAAPETAGRQASRADLRRLYDSHVTPELRASLLPSRRLRYDLGLLWRRLTA